MSGAALAALAAADAIPGIDALTIPLTVGVLAVTAVAALQAHHASESLGDHAPATPCATCADEIPCFNTPEGADPAEMKRQLKEQEDKINAQSPEEMQKRLDEAAARKDATGSYRPEGDAAARDTAREDFRTQNEADLAKQFRQEGLGAKDAARKAAEQTAQELAGLDATHSLDAIAGGKTGDAVSLGSRSVNRSIGAQWKSRVNALKDAIQRAKAKGAKKMDVRLDPCDGGPSS